MRLVLDTNVLISGTFWSGASYKIMQLIDEGKFELVLSKEILTEYDKIVHSNEILEKIETLQQLAIAAAVRKILLKAKLVAPKLKLDVLKADPDDNKILEAAIEGQASFIISNDKHLTGLRTYNGIKIVTPEEFLNNCLQTRDPARLTP